MENAEIDRVRELLKSCPKGITIAELAHQLGINRISASKYLNMLLASGQAEMRVFGPSKVFYPSQRIPLSSILNFSTSHLLVMDDNLIITDANNAILNFFAVEKKDLVGHKIDYSPLAGYLDSTFVPKLKRSLKSDDTHDCTFETRVAIKGKEYILEIKCIPTVFESGDHGVSLIADDITEITQYRLHLERLVDERANELQITNNNLKREINNHKKARSELKISEIKYRELVESANSIIIKTDTEGKGLFFNEFAQQFFGYTESEILGKSISDLIVPETDSSGKNIREIRQQLRTNPDTYGIYEGENIKRNGERIWISWTHKFIRNTQGEVTGILSIGNDITERKRAEEALKSSEERFRLAMDASTDGIWDWDITTDNCYFSPAYYRMLGYVANEFAATTFQEWSTLLHPDDKECTFSVNRDCIENRCQSFEIEHRLKANDGSWKWMLGRGKVVSRNAEGRALRIIGTHVDITERKRAEEALKVSEERFRLAMDASSDGIWDWDITTDNSYFSPAYYRMLGYEPGAFPSTGQTWITLIHPDDKERTLSLNRDCIENRCQSFELEYRLKAKDGSWKWMMDRGKAVSRDAGGRALRIIGTNIDITGRKLVENALRANQILLTEAMDLAHLVNWECDYETDIYTFDDRFYALYGTTAEREGGYQMPAYVYFREFVHPNDRGRIIEEQEWCREISDPDYISQQEHRIIRRDGGIRYISVRSERTTDNDGNIIKICGVNQDITERRIAEEKLCRSEEKLSAIVDYLPHATFVVDASGTVIAWNRAMEDLTGRKGEDIIGRGNFEHGFVLYGKRAPTLIDFVIHPDREIPEKYHIVKQEKNKLVARTYSRYLKPDGQTLLGFAVPLYDSNGNLVGAIESMRDVSGTELPRKVSSIDNP